MYGILRGYMNTEIQTILPMRDASGRHMIEVCGRNRRDRDVLKSLLTTDKTFRLNATITQRHVQIRGQR